MPGDSNAYCRHQAANVCGQAQESQATPKHIVPPMHVTTEISIAEEAAAHNRNDKASLEGFCDRHELL
jgi:hypothetical protein